MINYADYDFYANEYKGSLSIDLFNSLIIKASREIDKNVNKDLTEINIKRLTEREQWQLKYVACELCDFLKNIGGNSRRAWWRRGQTCCLERRGGWRAPI